MYITYVKPKLSERENEGVMYWRSTFQHKEIEKHR